jgi:hypothetical protein
VDVTGPRRGKARHGGPLNIGGELTPEQRNAALGLPRGYVPAVEPPPHPMPEDWPPRRKASKRRLLRRHARQGIARQADRTGCPRPDKVAYREDRPEQMRLAVRAQPSPEAALYRCRCGYVHWGKKADQR